MKKRKSEGSIKAFDVLIEAINCFASHPDYESVSARDYSKLELNPEVDKYYLNDEW